MRIRARLWLPLVVLALALLPLGCGDDAPLAPDTSTIVGTTDDADADAFDAALIGQKGPAVLAAAIDRYRTAGHNVVHLPAGSVDGLAAAIAAAGPKGVVVVDEGTHTENGTVTIDQRMRIVGDGNAVIVFGTQSTPPAVPIQPGLHVRADKVLIWGVTLQAATDPAGTGVLIDNARKVAVSNCRIEGHQFGIVLQNGDEARIRGNTISSTLAWLSDPTFEVHAILAINGDDVRIRDNDLSNSVFGLWACDTGGKAEKNTFHNNLIGLILCKVPVGVPMPDGSVVGSEFSATRWHVKDNLSTDNFDAGYMVIDGATQNLLVNNDANNNGSYDIELVGDSMRFGFLTPTSSLNTAVAGKFKSLVVKDCGLDNTLKGFDNIVDNNLDPCF